jgi:hypothetical protein
VIAAGQTVDYLYEVSNPGDVDLENVLLADDKCTSISGPTGDDANDGILKRQNQELWTYTCSMVVNEDTTNVATVTGTYYYPLMDTLTVTETATVNVVSPSVDVLKTPDKGTVYAGDTVTYTYTLTNTSNDALTSVTLADDKCSPVTQQTGDTTLDGGEAQTYSCSQVLTADTTNVATLTGQDALGTTRTFTGTATVDVIAPDVRVNKQASVATIYAGGSVTYTYEVTNNGSDELSNVTLTDDKCAPVTLVGTDDGNLQPGETLNYRCSTTLVGDTTNTGTFAGQDVLGKTWSFTDTATVQVLGPQIALSKQANRSIVIRGDLVRYDYQVTNPGNVPLTNIQVRDDKCLNVNFTGGDTNANSKLDPGETWSYWCSMELLVKTTNTATATARDSQGSLVTSPDAVVTVDVPSAFLPMIRRPQ